MSLRFRDLTNDDLPLIERWLHAEHVRVTWGDPTANLRLLREPPASGNRQAIIEADGHDVGIVLWQHPTREELDVAGLADIPTSVIDIDIMIGEVDAQGRGFGSTAINRVAELALSDPSVPFLMACARLDNLASQRAFVKTGGLPQGQGVRRRPERAARSPAAPPSGRAGRMNPPGPRFWEIFFEVYENLPRQGPGNRSCAARALALCRELPQGPAIIDLGCGVGGQTVQLAELTSGSIVAIDSHAPSVERLRAAIARRGLSQRVSAIVGNIASPGQPLGSFDLVWSEGALYNIGLRDALRVCHGLLRPGGYLAFTDAIWRQENPPPEVKAGFDLDYPAMGWRDDDVAAIRECGFELVGHFTLPDEAWWDDFYTPMEARIAELRGKYAGDQEALAVLDQLAAEPEMHRRHSSFYAYEFFVTRRPFGQSHAEMTGALERGAPADGPRPAVWPRR